MNILFKISNLPISKIVMLVINSIIVVLNKVPSFSHDYFKYNSLHTQKKY